MMFILVGLVGGGGCRLYRADAAEWHYHRCCDDIPATTCHAANRAWQTLCLSGNIAYASALSDTSQNICWPANGDGCGARHYRAARLPCLSVRHQRLLRPAAWWRRRRGMMTFTAHTPGYDVTVRRLSMTGGGGVFLHCSASRTFSTLDVPGKRDGGVSFRHSATSGGTSAHPPYGVLSMQRASAGIRNAAYGGGTVAVPERMYATTPCRYTDVTACYCIAPYRG